MGKPYIAFEQFRMGFTRNDLILDDLLPLQFAMICFHMKPSYETVWNHTTKITEKTKQFATSFFSVSWYFFSMKSERDTGSRGV